MTIASALTALNTDIVNARTAITNKGGTVTADGGSSQLATDIATIPTGGSSPVITSLSVTPTTSAQTITAPSGTDGYSPVNVAAVTASIDANITAGNIKNGVTILNVTGNYTGGGSSSRFGANLDTFLGDVDDNGILQKPTEESNLVFSDVEDIDAYACYYAFSRRKILSASFPDLTTISGNYACYYMFEYCTSLTSVSFPNLTTVSGDYACFYMFDHCNSLVSADLSNLTTVSGNRGCHHMFYYCTSLTSAILSKLTTISGSNGCYNMFAYCTSLTSVDISNLTTVSGNSGCGYFLYYTAVTSVSFPKLNDITGNIAFSYAFANCQKISSISFPALKTTSFGSKTTQFSNMFNGYTAQTSGSVTVHFPSNLSSTVSGLSGYPTFGGNSAKIVLKFDLSATS